MKKELTILLSGLTAMIIIFASAFAIGIVGRVHAEEKKDNRLENTMFENNTAKPDGAVYWHGDDNKDIPFINNKAEYGGTIVALEPDPNFHTSFTNNTAESGGAISWHDENHTDIPFQNNTAEPGGAIFVG